MILIQASTTPQRGTVIAAKQRTPDTGAGGDQDAVLRQPAPILLWDRRRYSSAPIRILLVLANRAVRPGPKSSVQRALAGLATEDWLTREGNRYVFVDSLYREYILRETR